MLLDAQRDLAGHAGARVVDMQDTITRLVELYDAWGKPESASAYRALLAS